MDLLVWDTSQCPAMHRRRRATPHALPRARSHAYHPLSMLTEAQGKVKASLCVPLRGRQRRVRRDRDHVLRKQVVHSAAPGDTIAVERLTRIRRRARHRKGRQNRRLHGRSVAKEGRCTVAEANPPAHLATALALRAHRADRPAAPGAVPVSRMPLRAARRPECRPQHRRRVPCRPRQGRGRRLPINQPGVAHPECMGAAPSRRLQATVVAPAS